MGVAGIDFCLFFLLPRLCLSNLHFSPVLRGNIFIYAAGTEALSPLTLVSSNSWKRKYLMAVVFLLRNEMQCLVCRWNLLSHVGQRAVVMVFRPLCNQAGAVCEGSQSGLCS